ncbi:50S ribosomal protein L28 [Candidatus Peribacteria bacterium RIFCSPHIGHO2_01_FULL_51_9]|nr:MAG: 50S ribosomal protein L28 [Candidatus Peribacteria bacterium RIFCSPHIGHO2_01_FULL_51_9]
MTRQCCKTGKKTSYGNTRSKSLRHTRRTFKTNLQKKRVFDPATGTYQVMRVSASYLRTLAKRLQAGKRPL